MQAVPTRGGGIVVDDADGLVFLPTGSPSPDYFGGLRPGDNRHGNAVVVLRAAHRRGCRGRFRPFTTTSGTTTSRRHHCFPARKARRWRLGRRRATSFFSSVSPGDHSFPLRSARFRRATCPVSCCGDTAIPQSAGFTSATANRRGGYLGRDCAGSRRLSRDVPHATSRGCVYSTQRARQSRGPRKRRRSALGRDGVGCEHTHDHCAREPLYFNRPPGAEVRTSSGRGEPTPQSRSRSNAVTPFAMSRQFFLAPSGIACVAPPWGELVAIYADTGETAWRSTLRGLALPPSVSRPGPPTRSINLGGPVVTTTGLVSSARPSIRISERSRRRAAARCGRVACRQAREQRLSCSPRHAGAR